MLSVFSLLTGELRRYSEATVSNDSVLPRTLCSFECPAKYLQVADVAASVVVLVIVSGGEHFHQRAVGALVLRAL
jgi:hypothetical protein